MSEVEKHGSMIIMLVIAITVIGITMGVTGLILAQIGSIQGVSIPPELTPSYYQGQLGLVLTLVVVAVVVSIIFGYVIPKLKGATRAAV
ncbi:MAG: hypothetical protein QXI60_05005 [Thermofilaceae archaeon]